MLVVEVTVPCIVRLKYQLLKPILNSPHCCGHPCVLVIVTEPMIHGVHREGWRTGFPKVGERAGQQNRKGGGPGT